MKRILIVEDEQSIAELERDYLEIEGYAADLASTGEEGLTKGVSAHYDLIILDVMLPGINGFEICKKIRNIKDIPIIMVTAKKEDVDKIRGLGIGADDYIVKPFSPGELVARVKAHLARYDRLSARETASNDIQVGGLHIDQKARRVLVNGKETAFAAKEFDMLVLFAANLDQVFTKEHLFERIWGLDSIGDVSTVTVHVRRIREKIEANPSEPVYLETVWGTGYRFRSMSLR